MPCVFQKNTFQVVMAVQGENTVFMFNYEKLEWTAPSSSAGCQHGAAVCPNLAALVSLRLFQQQSVQSIVQVFSFASKSTLTST